VGFSIFGPVTIIQFVECGLGRDYCECFAQFNIKEEEEEMGVGLLDVPALP